MKKLFLGLGIVSLCLFSIYQADSARAEGAGEEDQHYRTAISHNPQSALAHYYYANFLAKRMRAKEAIREYRVAYALEPRGPVATYCREALTAYGTDLGPLASGVAASRTAVPVVSGATGGTIGYNPNLPGTDYNPNLPGQTYTPSGSSSLSTYANALLRNQLNGLNGNTGSTLSTALPPDPTMMTAAGPRSNPALSASVSSIRREVEEAKMNNRSYANDMANSMIKAGDWKSREIQEQASRDIDTLYATTPMGYTSRSGRYYSNDLASRAAQIRRDAEEKAKYEQELAQQRSQSYKDWSRARQQDLENVASNLQEQMQTRPLYGPALDPNGTNLYVRNFKANPDKRPLPDAHFSVARIHDAAASNSSSEPAGTGSTVPQELNARQEVLK